MIYAFEGPLTRQWFIFQWVWHFQKHQLPSWHWTPSLNRNVCRSPHKPVSWARLLWTTERQTISQTQEKLYMEACKKIYNLPKNEPIKRIQLNIQDSKLGIISFKWLLRINPDIKRLLMFRMLKKHFDPSKRWSANHNFEQHRRPQRPNIVYMVIKHKNNIWLIH